MTSRKGSFGEYVNVTGRQLADVLRSPQGGLARWMLELGEAVKLEAQRTAPVYQPDPADPFAGRRIARRRPGTGRDSIVKRVAQGTDDFPLVVLVGTDDGRMALQIMGTAAHPIEARRAPNLVFWSGKQQRVVATKRVQHPGTAPNPFLQEALRTVVGREA